MEGSCLDLHGKWLLLGFLSAALLGGILTAFSIWLGNPFESGSNYNKFLTRHDDDDDFGGTMTR